MENTRLNEVVASLIPKLESSHLVKLKLSPDLLVDIRRSKDALIQLLEYLSRHKIELSPVDLKSIEELVDNANVSLDSNVADEQQLKFVFSSLLEVIKNSSEIIKQLMLPDIVEQIPSHLVKLLGYCSLFPKGHRFVRECLVHQWIAHCLLPHSRPSPNRRTYEEVGNSYFEELLSRGLFRQPIFVFGDSCRMVYSCEMHPVVHNAACRLAADAGEQLSVSVFDRRVFDDDSSSSTSSPIVTQSTKHIAFHKNGFSQFNLEKVLRICKGARTLLCFSPHWDALPGLRLLDTLSSVCVLDLSGCQFRELPFAKLLSLKYLGLSGNVLLQSLSGSFCPSLKTLALDGCVQLESSVGNYPKSLRHLYLTTQQPYLDFCAFGKIITLELSHCANLYSLSIFTIKIVRILECPTLKTVDFARVEELVLHNCASLVLDYGEEKIKILQEKREILCNYKFPERLELVGLPMVQLPDWLQFATALRYFMIVDCPQLEHLDGLTHLESVEEIYVYNCPKLQWLSEGLDSLPCLRLLDIRNCPNFYLESRVFQRMFAALPSYSSVAGHDETYRSSSHSTSASGTVSPSVSRIPDVYVDGELQNQIFSLRQKPNAQTDTHLIQSVPYFVVKTQMSKIGLRTTSRWHTLALVFKALKRLSVIVSPGREVTKLHCCLFPGDYEFEREKLIQLWMAVGFLGEKRMEIAGQIKFELLLEEQFILHARIDGLTRRKYKVNIDKVATFLDRVGTIEKKDVYFMLEDENATVDGSKFWHLSLVSSYFDQTTFETLKSFKELRTLLFVRNYGSSVKQIPSFMFLVLKSIQALDLSGSHITELPNSLGYVIQLRYLDLSFTLIETLPESIDRLHQLQTLKLEGCKRIHILPKGMKELISLRYLDFDVLGQLTFMPKGIGALTELRKLSAFVVDSEEGCSIGELKNMNNLEGSICISNLENAYEHEAHEATLSDKKHLTQLLLKWDDFKSYSLPQQDDVYRTIQNLKPNSSLEELQILSYPGFKLPTWVGSAEFEKLVSITFLKCANDNLNVTLGKLPNLKHLSIIQMHRLTKIGRLVHELYGTSGTFLKLETLIIDGMPNLEAWDGVCDGDFPLLSKLVVKQCPKLTVVPFLPYLISLEHLEISDCAMLKSLSDSLALSASLQTLVINNCPLLKERCKIGAEDWCKIIHVPDISADLEDVRFAHADGAVTVDSSTGSDSSSDADSC